jgi:hypothetical protein
VRQGVGRLEKVDRRLWEPSGKIESFWGSEQLQNAEFRTEYRILNSVFGKIDCAFGAFDFVVAGQVGLEPTTCGFGIRRSTNWSY